VTENEATNSGPREVAEAETAADKARLVGIMYSDQQWKVAGWMKGAFFYFALLMLVGLVAYGVDKRVTMRRLAMDSVVEPTPIKNIPAPEFVLPKGDSREGVKLSELQGKWVFVNFWATWCPPCRNEMPSMELLHRRMERDHGDKWEMVAISVDEDWSEVNRFFGETKPSFTVLWDKSKNVATRQWGTRKFPESYLIDPQGKVVAKFVGPRDWYTVGAVQYFDDVLSGKRDPSSSS